LRGRAPVADAPHTPRKRPTDLLLAASRPGAESFEINVGGAGHGAFSWAAQALIDRWGLHTAADGDVHVDLPYGDLTARLNALLTAMEVGQTCHFDAPAGQDERRVFAELKGLEAGQAAAPADLGGREISPGSDGKILVYKVTRVSDGCQKATLYAPGKDCGTAWESGKFYWSGVSEGWDWLAAGLASGNKFKIAYDSTVDSTPTNPYSQPTNVKVYVNSSTWNAGATVPALQSGDRMGSFLFDGSTGYVVTGTGVTIEWYLPSQPSSGYIVDTNNALKIVPIADPTAPSGSFYGDD
ncbi:MAG: hypothetical protein KC549_16505, partial [Myxococcales bacterium]|nr:hypothetical protein [Myxococcales bacterium]